MVSCSASISNVSKNKLEYVKDIIVCDFKAVNYKILNLNEVSEFFEDGKESIFVKYAATVDGENVKKIFIGERSIKILRKSEGNKIFYLASFKRKTFPFSACRKLKITPKYFK